jgi:acyl-coenzyme A synthetase/AMP-(fatty) acid ligase
MVPVEIIFLETLPKSSSGKVDKRELKLMHENGTWAKQAGA